MAARLFCRYSTVSDGNNEVEKSTIISVAPGYDIGDVKGGIKIVDGLSAAETSKILVTEIEVLDNGDTTPVLLILKDEVQTTDLISNPAFIGATINFVIIDNDTKQAFSQDYNFDGGAGTIEPTSGGLWPSGSKFTVCYNY